MKLCECASVKMRDLVLELVVAACVQAGPAGAAAALRPADAPRGAANLTPVPLRIANRSAAPIACEAEIAHWFSTRIGSAAAGEDVAAELWSDPATGTVVLLNAVGDRMPIQAIVCGFAGRAVTTGAAIPLQRRQGRAEPAVAFVCSGPTEAGRLDCQRQHPDAPAR